MARNKKTSGEKPFGKEHKKLEKKLRGLRDTEPTMADRMDAMAQRLNTLAEKINPPSGVSPEHGQLQHLFDEGRQIFTRLQKADSEEGLKDIEEQLQHLEGRIDGDGNIVESQETSIEQRKSTLKKELDGMVSVLRARYPEVTFDVNDQVDNGTAMSVAFSYKDRIGKVVPVFEYSDEEQWKNRVFYVFTKKNKKGEGLDAAEGEIIHNIESWKKEEREAAQKEEVAKQNEAAEAPAQQEKPTNELENIQGYLQENIVGDNDQLSVRTPSYDPERVYVYVKHTGGERTVVFVKNVGDKYQVEFAQDQNVEVVETLSQVKSLVDDEVKKVRQALEDEEKAASQPPAPEATMPESPVEPAVESAPERSLDDIKREVDSFVDDQKLKELKVGDKTVRVNVVKAPDATIVLSVGAFQESESFIKFVFTKDGKVLQEAFLENEQIKGARQKYEATNIDRVYRSITSFVEDAQQVQARHEQEAQQPQPDTDSPESTESDGDERDELAEMLATLDRIDDGFEQSGSMDELPVESTELDGDERDALAAQVEQIATGSESLEPVSEPPAVEAPVKQPATREQVMNLVQGYDEFFVYTDAKFSLDINTLQPRIDEARQIIIASGFDRTVSLGSNYSGDHGGNISLNIDADNWRDELTRLLEEKRQEREVKQQKCEQVRQLLGDTNQNLFVYDYSTFNLSLDELRVRIQTLKQKSHQATRPIGICGGFAISGILFHTTDQEIKINIETDGWEDRFDEMLQSARETDNRSSADDMDFSALLRDEVGTDAPPPGPPVSEPSAVEPPVDYPNNEPLREEMDFSALLRDEVGTDTSPAPRDTDYRDPDTEDGDTRDHDMEPPADYSVVNPPERPEDDSEDEDVKKSWLKRLNPFSRNKEKPKLTKEEKKERRKAFGKFITGQAFQAASSIFGVKFVVDSVGLFVERNTGGKGLGWGDYAKAERENREIKKLSTYVKETYDKAFAAEGAVSQEGREAGQEVVQERTDIIYQKIDALSHLSEEEKEALKANVKHIVDKGRLRREELKSQVGRRIDDVLKKYIKQKNMAMDMAADATNAVLFWTGMYGVRAGSSLMFSAIKRVWKGKHERGRNAGNQENLVRIAQDEFQKAFKEWGRGITAQGEKEGATAFQKGADMAKAVGTVIRVAGIGSYALAGEGIFSALGKWLDIGGDTPDVKGNSGGIDHTSSSGTGPTEGIYVNHDLERELESKVAGVHHESVPTEEAVADTEVGTDLGEKAETPPNLVRTEDGKLKPGKGYKWASDDPKSLEVVRIEEGEELAEDVQEAAVSRLSQEGIIKIQRGENPWKLIKIGLHDRLAGFSDLEPHQQNYIIDALKDTYVGHESDYVAGGKFYANRNFDFNKLYEDTGSDKIDRALAKVNPQSDQFDGKLDKTLQQSRAYNLKMTQEHGPNWREVIAQKDADDVAPLDDRAAEEENKLRNDKMIDESTDGTPKGPEPIADTVEPVVDEPAVPEEASTADAADTPHAYVRVRTEHADGTTTDVVHDTKGDAFKGETFDDDTSDADGQTEIDTIQNTIDNLPSDKVTDTAEVASASVTAADGSPDANPKGPEPITAKAEPVVDVAAAPEGGASEVPVDRADVDVASAEPVETRDAEDATRGVRATAEPVQEASVEPEGVERLQEVAAKEGEKLTAQLARTELVPPAGSSDAARTALKQRFEGMIDTYTKGIAAGDVAVGDKPDMLARMLDTQLRETSFEVAEGMVRIHLDGKDFILQPEPGAAYSASSDGRLLLKTGDGRKFNIDAQVAADGTFDTIATPVKK